MREEVVRELNERLNERSGCMKEEGMWKGSVREVTLGR
jgi:hypothetical protein